jgi:ATP-dependent Clp protease protease subunit
MMFTKRQQVLQAFGCSPQQAERWSELRNPVCNITIKAEEDNTAEIMLYDFIGFDWWTQDGIDAKTFAQEIAGLGKLDELRVRINSPGGDVFDGFAMYNILATLEYPVSVTIDSLAASAASIIAMAGDTIAMHSTSQLMIHDAWMGLIGNQQDMQEAAEVLGKLDGQIADVYALRGNKPANYYRDLMDKDTYLTPTEALDIGLATEIIQPKKTEKKSNAQSVAARNRMAAYLAIERKRLGR